MARYQHILCITLLIYFVSGVQAAAGGVICPPGFGIQEYKEIYARCDGKKCDKLFIFGNEVCSITYVADLNSESSLGAELDKVRTSLKEIKEPGVYKAHTYRVDGPTFSSYSWGQFKRVANNKEWETIYDEKAWLVRKHGIKLFVLYGWPALLFSIVFIGLAWLCSLSQGKIRLIGITAWVIAFVIGIFALRVLESISGLDRALRQDDYILKNLYLIPALTLPIFYITMKIKHKFHIQRSKSA